jgi:hypothetical protein
MTLRIPLLPKGPLASRELRELAHLAQLAFEWPIRQAPRLMLPLCILGAGILQTLMVVLFSISYRVPSEKTPEAPLFYFLPPDSEAAHQLAPWLEANDPAVFSPLRAARTALPSLPPLKYRPSYEEPPPALLPLRSEPTPRIEPSLPPLIAPLQRGTHDTKAPASPPLGVTGKQSSTVVRWEDELSARHPVEDAASSSIPVAMARVIQPAAYEVGVSPEGMPVHCVLMESSGDTASDEAARIWIMARRFQPQAKSKPIEAISWGRVLVLWGADASSAVPAASTPPVHPSAKP